jgi:formylglycine-generating enzyme required for sulfatase activity
MLDLVKIPGGSFLRGSKNNYFSKPIREVTVKTFLMGRYAVTQSQWLRVADLPEAHRKIPRYQNLDTYGESMSMSLVTWYEAIEFCDRLTALTGRKYRLPTESEWEYACRAGTTTAFSMGDKPSSSCFNYFSMRSQGIMSVGSFPPNPFGLYDMHGNVWEWCMDDYSSDYENNPVDGSAHIDPDPIKPRKIIRGGSFNSRINDCDSATRNDYTADKASKSIGFRVVVEGE